MLNARRVGKVVDYNLDFRCQQINPKAIKAKPPIATAVVPNSIGMVKIAMA